MNGIETKRASTACTLRACAAAGAPHRHYCTRHTCFSLYAPKSGVMVAKRASARRRQRKPKNRARKRISIKHRGGGIAVMAKQHGYGGRNNLMARNICMRGCRRKIGGQWAARGAINGGGAAKIGAAS